MNYDQAIRYLYNLQLFGIKLGLENIKRLLELLGNPHHSFNAIHIGGTKGKGSTAVMLASILKSQGYSTGLFTSPHLINFTERIILNGDCIKQDSVARLVEKLIPYIESMANDESYGHPTFFEVITALAFKYFESKGAEFVVAEVGLGGRLDATNVLTPLISVITNVSLDHTDRLGDTIEEIAYEKAGIIKENGIVVTAVEGGALKVIESVCREKRARLLRIGREVKYEKVVSNFEEQVFNISGLRDDYYNLKIPLAGDFQLVNACIAVCVAEILQELGFEISKGSIAEGLKNVRWHGRLEVIQKEPFVILDGAHNPESMMKIRGEIEQLFDYDRLILIIGVKKDKLVDGIITEILPIADEVIATQSKMELSTPAFRLKNLISKFGRECIAKDSVDKAIEHALSIAGKRDLILITGSLFIVGEALARFLGKSYEVSLQ